MTQTLPLPLTAAMLALANQNAALPRYSGAGVAGDWAGGVVGNDVNAASANVAVVNAASAATVPGYAPLNQVAKGNLMVPPLAVLEDTGIDYGVYTGLAGRTGTVTPKAPYPDATSPPVVTGMSPATGPAAGGTVVTITGINFTGATAVSFGGTAGTALTVLNTSTIRVTAPAHAAGSVNVVVTTPRGASPTSGTADNYLYV